MIDDPDSAGQVVSLPSWIPGNYMIRDFAKNVTRISASAEGGGVPMEKLDKDSWRCSPCTGPLQIEYQMYAWDSSVRSARHGQTNEALPKGGAIAVVNEGCGKLWRWRMQTINRPYGFTEDYFLLSLSQPVISLLRQFWLCSLQPSINFRL